MKKSISEDCTDEILFIGMRIAYFRKMRNMTQADLANLIHINKNYLSHIESGSSNKVLPLLIKISRALDVKLSTLVDVTDLENFNFDERNEILEQMNEIRFMYQQMKEITAGMLELDKIMDGLGNVENFSGSENISET